MPEDDDRTHDASSAAGPGWSDADSRDLTWADAVAPDDISELDRDIQAYHRELRADRRRSRYRRFVARPDATPLVLVVTALALVASVAALLTVFGPRIDRDTTAKLPLSDRPADGKLSHLLPKLDLRGVGGTSRSNAQELRPGLIALLPAHCSCGAQIHDLDVAAVDADAPLYVVAPGEPSADADSLAGQLHDGVGAGVFEDPLGALNRAVGARGLTVVLVDRDGTIREIDPHVTTTRGLTDRLSDMLQPQASI